MVLAYTNNNFVDLIKTFYAEVMHSWQTEKEKPIFPLIIINYIVFRLLCILQDVQWTDLDYMDKGRDWTYDKKLFGGLPDVIRNLHAHNQKYMIIVVSIVEN